MIYALMLAFQLSGALILLVKNINGQRKAIIKNCFPGSNFVDPDLNDRCTISKDRLQKSASSIYLNIIAFTDLTIGYILAACLPTSLMERLSMAMITIVLTVCILLAAMIFTFFIFFSSCSFSASIIAVSASIAAISTCSF